MPREMILILDFGSQYTQLIARRVRESRVYCEIHPFHLPVERIREMHPGGIILSGGPASVYGEQAPRLDPAALALGIPVLGICYGLQMMAFLLDGRVEPSEQREYGRARIVIKDTGNIFSGFEPGTEIPVWMSHGDRVEKLPPGFELLAQSGSSPAAAVADRKRRLFGVQFHPEVVHTPRGREILDNFVFRICGMTPSWTMRNFIEVSKESIRQLVGDGRVICALSGGVDSSVVAALLHLALGDRLTCIFVDNGVLRQGEAKSVEETFGHHFKLDLRVIDATERFLTKLAGVTDPEAKRKVIGNEFIAVFDAEAANIGQVDYLAQGTLYPDVIESVSFKGPSATIKSHHNVGGLPEKMKLKLIEPLRELFKDEVRLLGRELGLPEEIITRQPFPGPGLAIRILGEVTRERLEIVRGADAIVAEEMRVAGYYDRVWQSFAILLPVRTVGVMGDERTYEHVIAVRIVDSLDGMTADWVQLPHEVLGAISNRIINEVKGVNRVVYDISSKPPSTIEWE